MRLLSLSLALTLVCTATAVEVPDWVLRGILATETRSYYRDNGTIAYVDKRRGSAGELGCFQITRAAFNQVKRRGEQFWQVETDRYFCQEIATRYLLWLHKNYDTNWYRVIEMYNAGPNNHSATYLRKVLNNAK